ncbi:MAG: hypothetical protein LBJ15_13585 [Comamonas sp.]|jgi:hypothetical protein|uniref:hypothetical protein n=1 Tax=Comamonas sp. TaxID=34028 RepID=UPI00281BA122|nr:hypothetical protein [Comamonas sp.]MDR0215023.1 hypothetical protein [Comamonas sp.]
MSRNLFNAAALALAAAALLAACDKTKSPSPTTTPAADAAAALPRAEVKAGEPAQVEIKQVNVLHVAKEGEESLGSLAALEGKYRWDGVDYLKEGVLAQRLKALLGDKYETVLKNLETVGPLEVQGGELYVFGNRQHQGGEESAAIVINPERNGLRVWLLSAGQQTVFTDADGEAIRWPESVQTLMNNQAG